MPRYYFDQTSTHRCELLPDNERGFRRSKATGKWENFKTKVQKLGLISERNIRSHIYLRSRGAIELEKRRQMRSRYWYIVHPFSELRHYWELTMCIVLFFTLFMVPFQCAFYSPFVAKYSISKDKSTDDIYLAVIIVSATDIFFILDIVGNFFTGYHIPRTKQIVMNPFRIIRNYIFHYFFLDIAAATPLEFIILFGYDMERYSQLSHPAYVTVQLFNLLKLLRLRAFVQYFNRVCEKYSASHLIHRIFVMSYIYFLIIHWAACSCILFPEMLHGFGMLDPSDGYTNTSWILRMNLLDRDVADQYFSAVFRSLTNVSGVGTAVKGSFNLEDQMISIVTSIIGRCYWTYFLVAFLQVITTIHSSRTKFFEVLDQLKQYMKHKQFPPDIQKRLIDFYRYRFQTHYFRESLILSSMSQNLRKEISMYTCHKLIENSEIFHILPKHVISSIVERLKFEVYLPNDVIVEAGTVGDCMYFLASGTATVLTPSGKKIYQLRDGDYFGEIALVLEEPIRMATVVAAEVTEIYRLNNIDFSEIVEPYPEVYERIEKNAIERYKATTKLDNTLGNIDFHVKIRRRRGTPPE